MLSKRAELANYQTNISLQSSAYLCAIVFTLAAGLMMFTPTAAHAQDKSGVKPQVISLPSGPGSLEGLGETFEPDLSTGTSSYPVKFTAAPGRVGFQPELSLAYNGGNANGPWGMGWKLSTPSIQRRTEDGLPTYDDGQDIFIYSSGEKLVALTNGDYRFENEGSFMRFRRIEGGGWEAYTPDGVRYVFGETDNARVDNHLGIFRWELERVIDTHGNEMRYSYLHDGEYAYPREIRYNFGQNNGSEVYNAVIFNYEPRPDTYTDRRSGSPIRMGLRGTDIQMWALGKLVRAYRLTYEPERSTGKYSLLASVTQVGDDGVSTLPPHTFTYTQFDATTSAVVPMQNIPPVPLSNPDADLVDINADGLPDLVYTPEDGQHRFYLNRGQGRWQVAPVLPQNSPAERLSNPNVRMADLNGDGVVDLLVKAGTTAGAPFYYYSNSTGGEWTQADRVDFGLAPAFDLNDPNVQLLDVNNDRSIDVVWSVSGRLKIWLAREGGWSQEADFDVPAPAAGDAASFADPKFKIGDLTGDRMEDVVMVRDGQVVLWEHNGNGDYEEPHAILNPPTGLGAQDVFIQMGDLNNDGLMDLVLPGNRVVTYWLSLGDGSLTDAIIIPDTPAFDAQESAVRLADIDGDGATELVFSSAAGMEYVDFSTREQPFLLRSVDNGLGRTIHITYKSSIEDYIADWDAGAPWRVNLPFPVQVVNKVTVHDANSGDDYTIDYHYRDGFYDGVQKEFRGFVRSQEIKRGDETAATTVTNLVYDVGMVDESRKGMLLESEVLAEGGRCNGSFAGCFQRTVNQLATRVVVEAGQTATGKPIAYAFVSQTDSFIHEQQAEPVHLRQSFEQDSFGNQTHAFQFGKVCGPEGRPDVTCGNDEILTYTEYIYDEARYLLNRALRVRQTDANGNFVSEARLYYDGEPYVGLPAGQLTRGDLTRKEENLGPNGGDRFIPTKRQRFDDYGNVIGIMDGNGHITTVAYDPVQHTFPVLERIHFDGGSSLSYAAAYHMSFGKITGATDYNGHAHAFVYDTFGRIVKIVSPGDTLARPTQQFRYEIGSPRSAIYSDLRVRSGEDAVISTVVYYDGLGRQLQKRTLAEDGKVVVTEAVTFNARQSVRDQYSPYFDTGLEYRTPDPTLLKATVHYDPMARTARTTNPDGTYSSISYGPLTQMHFDEEDNAADSPHANTPTTFVFDGLERLLSTEEINIANGQLERYLTRYEYDRLGNLVRLTDAQGNVKTMIYDALGRKLRMVDPDKGEMNYQYDDAGNLLMTRDALGQEIHRTYDAAHRLLRERWVYNDSRDDVLNAVYHYDGDRSPRHPDAQNTLGQIAYIEDQAGSVHFSYDPRGNVIGTVRHFNMEDLALVTRLHYDAMDRLVQATFPDGSTVDYLYNERGLLQSIPGFVPQIDYNASAMRESIRYANSVQTSYGYDARLRLQHLQTTSRAAVLQDLTYTLDKVSNVLSISDGRAERSAGNGLNQSFVYDALYRMVHAGGAYGQIDFGYDAIGNMVRKASTAADVRLNLGEMRYGEAGAGPHALTSAGGESWGYDANGNLSQRGGVLYQWDARNQLRSVDDGTMRSSFVYDVDGQRVKQVVQVGGDVTTTLYAGQYAEVRGDDLIFYIFDEQNRVAQVTKKLERDRLLTGFGQDSSSAVTSHESLVTVHWYLADHLGSTSLLLDANGNVASEVAYYPFGLTRYEHNGGLAPYRFTGQEQDASGLMYYDARYYEPVTGRFISVDPLFVESPMKGVRNPQLLNLYAYALNNPGRYTDPDGTEPESVNKLSMTDLRVWAGDFEKRKVEMGYDAKGMLDNPRLSPEMVWQLHHTMRIYSYVMEDRDLESLLNGTVRSGVRVVRGFDGSDSGSIYDLGLGLDVKIVDRQGRHLDPTTEQGRRDYATFMRIAEGRGFTASLVTPDEGQSYIRLRYTPNQREYEGVNGKLLTSFQVKTARQEMNWHMQDLRKHVWRVAHGSYWRLRYAMNNPIRPK